MTTFTRKERREARLFERRLAKRLKRQQTPGVSFKTEFRTVSSVQVLPGRVTIEGTDQNGTKVAETQEVQNPNYPTRYYLTTGELR